VVAVEEAEAEAVEVVAEEEEEVAEH